MVPHSRPPQLCPEIPVKDTHYYRYRPQGRFLPYTPPKPSFCDLYPDAVAFYEEWIEYRREVKVERGAAWYTWLTLGLLESTTTKIIIHETHWRIDHFCNGSTSERYVIAEQSYVDEQIDGFAFIWDNLVGDSPERRSTPRRREEVIPSSFEEPESDRRSPLSPQTVEPPKGEVIDDDYIARLKEKDRGNVDSSHNDGNVSGIEPRVFREDIIVREKLAENGYTRIIGTAKDKAKPITLTQGSTIDGSQLPHEFLSDYGGVVDGRYVVEYVGVKPATHYGNDALILTIKVRETY